VGEGAAEEGAHLLARVVSEAAILVVSTDLSHYHDAATADRLDARTAAAIEALDEGSIEPEDACGSQAVRVALAWARAAGLRVRLLERRDSSDAGGDTHRVVGYGAFSIERPTTAGSTGQTADAALPWPPDASTIGVRRRGWH
jgi:AmmeMemoRadiSam system protein B